MEPYLWAEMLLKELLPCYSACCAKPAWRSGFYWKGARHVCFQEPAAVFSLRLHMKDCSRKRDIVSTFEAGQSWVRPWKQARGGELNTPCLNSPNAEAAACKAAPSQADNSSCTEALWWWFPPLLICYLFFSQDGVCLHASEHSEWAYFQS